MKKFIAITGIVFLFGVVLIMAGCGLGYGCNARGGMYNQGSQGAVFGNYRHGSRYGYNQ